MPLITFLKSLHTHHILGVVCYLDKILLCPSRKHILVLGGMKNKSDPQRLCPILQQQSGLLANEGLISRLFLAPALEAV